MKKGYFSAFFLFFLVQHEVYALQNCNGFLQLCDRRYNEVTFPTTHNGLSDKPPTITSGASIVSVQNQDKAFIEQLKAGIRATKLPLHWENNILKVCHGFPEEKFPVWVPQALNRPCQIDPATESLLDVLKILKKFLDENPREIFTFFLEGATGDHAKLAEIFAKAGFNENNVHAQLLHEQWPTLGQMINNNKRLVVFVSLPDSKSSSKIPWLHLMDEFVWQTDFKFGDIKELKKDIQNPKIREGASQTIFDKRLEQPDNKISVVQHFITPIYKKVQWGRIVPIGGTIQEAKIANSRPILMKRLEALEKKAHVPLNFIWVDFFEYGDLFDVINELNKVGKYSPAPAPSELSKEQVQADLEPLTKSLALLHDELANLSILLS
jgi:hypothetical protein